jgi:hypothetical protein
VRRDDEPYITGPEPRRLTPWLWVAAMALAFVKLGTDNDPFWLGPVLFLCGITIAAQALDAVRTGRLLGRFPNRFPIDAVRRTEPFSFWLMTVVYVVMGLMFMIMGVLAVAEQVR